MSSVSCAPFAPAAGLSQLGAEAEGARPTYGEGALIMCDRLVRIYAADGAPKARIDILQSAMGTK